jgi:hypothetical protein
MVSLSVTVIKIEIILGPELEFGELSENGRCSSLQMYLPHRNLCGGKGTSLAKQVGTYLLPSSPFLGQD